MRLALDSCQCDNKQIVKIYHNSIGRRDRKSVIPCKFRKTPAEKVSSLVSHEIIRFRAPEPSEVPAIDRAVGKIRKSALFRSGVKRWGAQG